MNFRDNVLQLLEDKGINQLELAERLGKSQPNVSMILKKNSPSFQTIKEFAIALGVDVSEITKLRNQKVNDEDFSINRSLPSHAFAGSSMPTFDLMRTEGNTDFLDMRNDRFLIVTPVISQNYAKVYIKRLQDPEAVAALRKHAVTTKSPKFGEYLSVEVDFNISLRSEIGNLTPGTIVTGRKFINWANPKLGDLDEVDCILVLASEIVVTTIIDYDATSNKVTYADKEINSQAALTISSDEILEFYEIEIVTNYGSNNY